MQLVDEQSLLACVASDPWMVRVLDVVRSLGLPDSWVAAGFVRNKVWDVMHGYTERTPLTDVDVIYYDKFDIDEAREKIIEGQLKTIDLNIPWSVKNMARMYLVNGDSKQYESSEEAVRHWPETATAVGARVGVDGRLELLAPYGIDDLVHLRVVMSPGFGRDASIYRQRIAQKNWQKLWPKLTIVI